ncbi:MAG: hypothetical protein J6X65_05115 [Bacteroidales bacterium]|nr:hypothetical protein [Bacteroidales bacterium]
MVVKDDYHPKNLFPWISPAHRTVLGYCHASPNGENNDGPAQLLTTHCSLLTGRSPSPSD